MITRVSACRILHGRATPRCEAHVDKEFAGYYTVQFMDVGQVELFYGRKRHILESPCFWFCMPGVRIRFHAWGVGWWSHRYFAFTGPRARQWMRQGFLPATPVACPASRVAAVIRRMREIEEFAKESDALGNMQAVNALEGLLLDIERMRTRREKKTFWADQVGETWKAAMHRPMDYAALAAAHGMALSTFRRLFRLETGMGPHQYVQKLRIEEARLRLEHGEKNQKEMAAALGYTDVYHFNRDFRRRAGLPPAQYQSSLTFNAAKTGR